MTRLLADAALAGGRFDVPFCEIEAMGDALPYKSDAGSGEVER
jgi:hypothetical protein